MKRSRARTGTTNPTNTQHITDNTWISHSPYVCMPPLSKNMFNIFRFVLPLSLSSTHLYSLIGQVLTSWWSKHWYMIEHIMAICAWCQGNAAAYSCITLHINKLTSENLLQLILYSVPGSKWQNDMKHCSCFSTQNRNLNSETCIYVGSYKTCIANLQNVHCEFKKRYFNAGLNQP